MYIDVLVFSHFLFFSLLKNGEWNKLVEYYWSFECVHICTHVYVLALWLGNRQTSLFTISVLKGTMTNLKNYTQIPSDLVSIFITNRVLPQVFSYVFWNYSFWKLSSFDFKQDSLEQTAILQSLYYFVKSFISNSFITPT